ncbi:MAG: hypothetical protein QOF39_1649 [Frankiales bacterium]|nr:hypothetical protein [Frankiales bacterium]
MSAVLRRLAVERAGGLAVLIGLTLLRLLTDAGLGSAVATELYLLAVTGVVLSWCLRLLAATEARERFRPPAYGRRRLEGRPERLVSLEESMPYWTAAAGPRHYRLRPEVRSVVAERLTRLGIDLRTDQRAESALGRTVWDLVRADVPPPVDEHGPGLSPVQVDELIARLEALERPDFPVPAQSGDQQ